MPRGGHNKPTWNAGKTTVIRIPESKKDYIMALVRTLDDLDWNVEILDKAIYDEIISLLTDALTIPRNNGSKYRSEIIKALIALDEYQE